MLPASDHTRKSPVTVTLVPPDMWRPPSRSPAVTWRGRGGGGTTAAWRRGATSYSQARSPGRRPIRLAFPQPNNDPSRQKELYPDQTKPKRHIRAAGECNRRLRRLPRAPVPASPCPAPTCRRPCAAGLSRRRVWAPRRTACSSSACPPGPGPTAPTASACRGEDIRAHLSAVLKTSRYVTAAAVCIC